MVLGTLQASCHENATYILLGLGLVSTHAQEEDMET